MSKHPFFPARRGARLFRAMHLLATPLLAVAAVATAADETPANAAPAAEAAPAATTQTKTAPVSLNSGTAPEEFAADSSKVTLEKRADGTRLYHMNGQGMEAVTAHIGADGKVQLRCSDAGEKVLTESKAENAHEN